MKYSLEGLQIYEDGTKRWYQNDMLHREDGPAVIFGNGSYQWYEYGKLHRFDGPAAVFDSGSLRFWRIHDEPIDEEEYQQWLLDNGMDIAHLTEEDKQFILMVWG